jgi:hypothetical protein
VIRLLLAVGAACAVVWAVGSDLSALVPSDDARAAVERTAKVAREEAAKLLVPSQPEPVAPVPPPVVQPLAPEESVESPAEFAPEPQMHFEAPEAAPAVTASTVTASKGWDAPLDSEQAEAVRCRLDRVMELAAGNAE